MLQMLRMEADQHCNAFRSSYNEPIGLLYVVIDSSAAFGYHQIKVHEKIDQDANSSAKDISSSANLVAASDLRAALAETLRQNVDSLRRHVVSPSSAPRPATISSSTVSSAGGDSSRSASPRSSSMSCFDWQPAPSLTSPIATGCLDGPVSCSKCCRRTTANPDTVEFPSMREVSCDRIVNTSRYKTELCRQFEESGTCRYSDKCQFAHGVSEIRSVNRHPKYKTEMCRTFHTTGFCPYGLRCHFIHNEDERRTLILTAVTPPLSSSSPEVDRLFRRGRGGCCRSALALPVSAYDENDDEANSRTHKYTASSFVQHEMLDSDDVINADCIRRGRPILARSPSRTYSTFPVSYAAEPGSSMPDLI